MDIKTADRLYEYRKANGYSQEELADKIDVSRQAISKWERSVSSPDTDNLIMLAKLYGVTLDELVNGESVPESKNEAKPEESSLEIKNGEVYFHGNNGNDDNAFEGTPEDSGLKKFIKKLFKNESSRRDDPSNPYNAVGVNLPKGSVNSICVNWLAGDVCIKRHDGEEIIFKEDYQKNSDHRLRYNVSGKALTIKYCRDGSSCNIRAKNLTILLPMGLELKSLRTQVVSADVRIESIIADRLDCNTVSGSTSITGSFIDINYHGVSGGIYFETATAFEKIVSSTVSGNAKFVLPADFKGLDIDSTSISGGIKLDNIDMKPTEMIVVHGHQHYLFGDGSLKITHNSTSGNIMLTRGNN